MHWSFSHPILSITILILPFFSLPYLLFPQRHLQICNFQLQWKCNLISINQSKWSTTSCWSNISFVCPQCIHQLIMLISLMLLNYFAKDVDNDIIYSLNLTITIWEICIRKPFLDIESLAKFPYMLSCEILSIIHDNIRWHSKPCNNTINHKIYNLRTF